MINHCIDTWRVMVTMVVGRAARPCCMPHALLRLSGTWSIAPQHVGTVRVTDLLACRSTHGKICWTKAWQISWINGSWQNEFCLSPNSVRICAIFVSGVSRQMVVWRAGKRRKETVDFLFCSSCREAVLTCNSRSTMNGCGAGPTFSQARYMLAMHPSCLSISSFMVSLNTIGSPSHGQ